MKCSEVHNCNAEQDELDRLLLRRLCHARARAAAAAGGALSVRGAVLQPGVRPPRAEGRRRRGAPAGGLLSQLSQRAGKDLYYLIGKLFENIEINFVTNNAVHA